MYCILDHEDILTMLMDTRKVTDEVICGSIAKATKYTPRCDSDVHLVRLELYLSQYDAEVKHHKL